MRISRLQAELEGREVREISPDKLPEPGGPPQDGPVRGLRGAAGRSSFVIDWKGDLIPCDRMDIIREHPLEDGFREAWKRINRQVNEWPMVPECRGCLYEKSCNNCAAEVLQYGEAGKRPEELCKLTRYLVCHGVRSFPNCG